MKKTVLLLLTLLLCAGLAVSVFAAEDSGHIEVAPETAPVAYEPSEAPSSELYGSVSVEPITAPVGYEEDSSNPLPVIIIAAAGVAVAAVVVVVLLRKKEN